MKKVGKVLEDILYAITFVIAIAAIAVLAAFPNGAAIAESKENPDQQIEIIEVNKDEPIIYLAMKPGEEKEFLAEFVDQELPESFFRIDATIVTTNEEDIENATTGWINYDSSEDVPILTDSESSKQILFYMSPPKTLPIGEYEFQYVLDSDEAIRLTLIIEIAAA